MRSPGDCAPDACIGPYPRDTDCRECWVAHLSAAPRKLTAALSHGQSEPKKADVVLEKILELVPEESHQQIRERVSLFILEKINSGDRASLLNFGKYYLKILPEEDYNKSYLFYSIAAAFGEEGAKDKRDAILSDVDNEKIVEIQSQASEMFEKLRKGEKIEMLKD